MKMVDISVDGNARFSGFIKDLMTSLTADPEIDADFELLTVNDGKYGSRLRRDKWDGMIGELHRKVSALIGRILAVFA